MDLGPQEILRQRALRSLNALPPFSPILSRVLASLAGADVSFAMLSDLIEKDTVLSGNILQLVNSSLYARRGTINSVRHALSILGTNKLRNAVLGMSVTRMWNQLKMPASWSMARFNMHSAATATLSDLLAQQLPVTYPEGAFVAGLLHDVGRLLIAVGLPEKHELILQLRKTSGRSPLECELEILGFTHPELSAEALSFWNLPAPIGTAVLYHHNPASDDSNVNPAEIPLSRVLDAANQYINSTGVTIIPESTDSADAGVVTEMGLTPERLATLLTEFNVELDGMIQFFR